MEQQQASLVATSTTEAEYISLSSMAKEVLFLRQLLESINYCELFTTKIFADNMAANFHARNAKLTTRSKHFDIRLHHIRDLVEREKMLKCLT